MSSQNENETPGLKTAGIVSASQLTNVTAENIIDPGSSTSDSLRIIILKHPTEEKAKKPPVRTRKGRFREVLRKAIRRQRDTLQELAKY